MSWVGIFGVVLNFHFSIRERKKEDFCYLGSADFFFLVCQVSSLLSPSFILQRFCSFSFLGGFGSGFLFFLCSFLMGYEILFRP